MVIWNIDLRKSLGIQTDLFKRIVDRFKWQTAWLFLPNHVLRLCCTLKLHGGGLGLRLNDGVDVKLFKVVG